VVYQHAPDLAEAVRAVPAGPEGRSMTWWKWWARRAIPTWSTSQSLADFESLFAEVTTSSTMVASASTAVTVPAVFACLQVLSQDVARTPIKLRRRVAEDTFVDAIDHDLYEILHDLPNPEQTAYDFKRMMTWNLLTYGRAFAQVVRVDGRVQALWPLDPRSMRVDRDDARRKRWTYTRRGRRSRGRSTRRCRRSSSS
jgi:phage portal protein BeeE